MEVMVPEGDFSERTKFPGTEGGLFELLVRHGRWFQRVPSPLLALALVGWAWLLAGGGMPRAAFLAGFFLVDWLLLSSLPRLGISFGPSKPAVVLLALLRAPFAAFLAGTTGWILQLIGSLLVIYAFGIEPQHLHLTSHQLMTDKLKSGESIRLLHIGDLHMEGMTRLTRKLISRLGQLKPDLICFSGDFLSYSDATEPVAVQLAREVIGQLKAPLGVFAVRGSPPVDKLPLVREILNGLDAALLEGEATQVRVGETIVNLVGIPCSHRPFADGPVLERIMRELVPGFNILLYHSPDLAPIAARAGIDLQLSGHTHGGQVRLPWYGALYTSSLYGKRFEAGRYQLGNTTLCVTRGLGFEGMAAPRVRFLCSPEIIEWELVGTG